MPTENLPTTDAPIRPGETLIGNPPPPSPNRSGDTLLIWCFVASLVICAILGFLLNYADLYGTQATSNQQKVMKLRVYRPPVKHHVKPKPPKPPKIKPPPPHITHVIPKVQPRPIPRVQPRPTPRTITTTARSTQANAPVIAAAPPAPEQPAVPLTPSPEPAPPPVKAEPPAPPPAPVAPPTPPAPIVKYVPPPPPPAPKPKPKPAIPDQETPELLSGSFSDINLPQFDPSSLNVTSVTVNWEVDSRGNVHDIKFKPTGNSDVDQAIRTAVQNFKFSPRVINGVPQPSSMSHEFDLG